MPSCINSLPRSDPLKSRSNLVAIPFRVRTCTCMYRLSLSSFEPGPHKVIITLFRIVAKCLRLILVKTQCVRYDIKIIFLVAAELYFCREYHFHRGQSH